MKNKGDHRRRNSAQYERVVELLIMHKAKRTPRQISLLPDFRSCLVIDLGETDGNNEICLGVRFALCIILRLIQNLDYISQDTFFSTTDCFMEISIVRQVGEI